MNVPFKLRDEALDKRVPDGAEAARPDPAQGPPLGRRHARVDLQRDADRGRAGAGRRTCASSSGSTADARATASCVQPASPRRASSGCRRRTTPSARRRVARRDPAALARPARRRRSRRASRRSGAPAPAPTTSRWPSMSRARRAGVQRARRERQRGEGAGARGAADRRAQPGPGAALRRRAADGRGRPDFEQARRGRQEAVRRLRAAGPHARHRSASARSAAWSPTRRSSSA